MHLRRLFLALDVAAVLAIVPGKGVAQTVPGAGQTVDGAALLRLLGPYAKDAFAPRSSPGIGALVQLPAGVHAADLGLREAAPGIGRLWGTPSQLVAFADAHPGLRIEVAPPLHTLLDTAGTFVAARAANAAGLDGSGVVIGIADTGIDLTHSDFIDAQLHTRVAWLLDLSAPPAGKHPDLEQKFGSTDASGKSYGAVWSADDINAALAQGRSSQLPQDEVGHGTLVASCAAGNGRSVYKGIAVKASIVVARITGAASDSIGNDELLRGVDFLFDRADAMHQPAVVNLSIGTDFGPHDGSMSWEQTLAGYVGPTHPGHALVAAAGNSGSITDIAVHQSVHVSDGTMMRVPIVTGGATNGGVQVWVAMHGGADLRVGLDGPDGTWISPVAGGSSAGKNTNDYNAAVYNGSTPAGSPVPAQSHGAVVVWQNKWPTGTYNVTLSGTGTAELYLQATGDASVPGIRNVGFAHGVREGTINLPATSAAILGVGCTINKTSWNNVSGVGLALVVPVLDPTGGLPDPGGATRDAIPGEPCWFSSAGPTLTGLQKPEIMAPGAAIVGAMSAQAHPPSSSSIFTNPNCPNKSGTGTDPTCQQVDAEHGTSFGTSFSAPIVAGAVAILLQHDPTLTQDAVVAALQGGAHPLRGTPMFQDQLGVGEVDVPGAVAAAERLRNPLNALPVRAESWMTLSADVYLADGSTPLQAIIELRATRPGTATAPPADGFAAGRLAAYALVDGAPFAGAVHSLVRRGPGVWLAIVQLPPGLGGSKLTVGATFDGLDIVEPKSIPIATDVWEAAYPPRVQGGCAVGGAVRPSGDGAAKDKPGLKEPGPKEPGCWAALAIAGAIAFLRRRAVSRFDQ
jgi:subtilisin family serine protease